MKPIARGPRSRMSVDNGRTIWAHPKLCLALADVCPDFVTLALNQQLLKHTIPLIPDSLRAFLVSIRSDDVEVQLKCIVKPAVDLVGVLLRPVERAEIVLADQVLRKEVGEWFISCFGYLKSCAELDKRRPSVGKVWTSCFEEVFGAWAESEIIYDLPKPLVNKQVQCLQSLLIYVSNTVKSQVELILQAYYQTNSIQEPDRSSRTDPFEEAEQLLKKLKTGNPKEQRESIARFTSLFPELIGPCLSGKAERMARLFKASAIEEILIYLEGGSSSAEESDPTFALGLLELLVWGAFLSGETTPAMLDEIGLRVFVGGERRLATGRKWYGGQGPAIIKILALCFQKEGKLQLRRLGLIELCTAVAPGGRFGPPNQASDSEMAARIVGNSNLVVWHFITVLMGRIPMESMVPLLDYCDEFSLRIALGPLTLPESETLATSSANVSQGDWTQLELETRVALGSLALKAALGVASGESLVGPFELANVGYIVAVIGLCAKDAQASKEAFSGKVAVLASALSRAYAFLSTSFRSSNEGEGHKITLWGLFCTVLADPLRMLFQEAENKGPDALVSFCHELARSGGIEMSVQMIRDTREGLLDSPLLPPLEDWLSFLQSFGEKLWAMFAEEYDLKSCSNPACCERVKEIAKNTFKKCSGCRMVQYCSQKCQRCHWKEEHKAVCAK